ncbi:YcxB family protein [Phytohabitans rumicis]|uniref:Uncharacterized protein n=1 Tax=Phytohabitans rumicis TaxID=1076125 RepID=A0A6V8LG31_9ACTN|nr:YcxB family protein [Phytohabitans rumicis]GFJ96212.1 hypothetical protein Prum_098540 [Phytohabitans rumicis]
MQISVWVPYDEARLRRTLTFVLRPQTQRVRLIGVALVLLGLLLVALDPSVVLSYGVVFLGLFFAVAIGPITVSRAVGMQSNVIREGLHLTMDDEWITVTYPLAETRFRWAGLGKVIETRTPGT